MGLQSNMQLYMLVWRDVQSIYWLKKQETQLYIWYDVLFRLKTWIYTIKGGGLEASMTSFEY